MTVNCGVSVGIPERHALRKQQPRGAANSTSSSWAIVGLVYDDAGAQPLVLKRNELLAAYLLKQKDTNQNVRNITVLFLAEGNITEKHVSAWTAQFDGLASVRYIDTREKALYNHSKPIYGYKYMCKMFMLDVYGYLRDEFDFYWRVDTDCFLTALDYNIFDWFETNQLTYAYPTFGLETHEGTKHTLPSWVTKYTLECGIVPSFLGGHMVLPGGANISLGTCIQYYNNFHLGRVSFFLREDVSSFLLNVNASHLTSAHRWGDAPVQAYALRLFGNDSQIRQIENMTYIHGSHRHVVKNGVSEYRKGILGRCVHQNQCE